MHPSFLALHCDMHYHTPSFGRSCWQHGKSIGGSHLFGTSGPGSTLCSEVKVTWEMRASNCSSVMKAYDCKPSVDWHIISSVHPQSIFWPDKFMELHKFSLSACSVISEHIVFLFFPSTSCSVLETILFLLVGGGRKDWCSGSWENCKMWLHRIILSVRQLD